MKKNVVFGHIGRGRDRPNQRSDRWRPTLSIFMHDDFKVSRFHLIYNSFNEEEKKLSSLIQAEIGALSTETEVVLEPMDIKDLYDFKEVYTKLYEFCNEIKFEPEHEEYYFHITTNTHVWQVGIFLVVYTNVFPGKIFQTWGPNPFEGRTEQGYHSVELNLGENAPSVINLRKKKPENEDILKSGVDTKNENYNRLIKEIELFAANSELPILLLGKTGTGKTFLARRIYSVKKNVGLIEEGDGKLVEVDCTAIPEALLEGELFGYKKGAFTGAIRDFKGLIKEADRGLLFIDEIGNLSLEAQAKLLKVIEDKEFRPIGGDFKDIQRSDFQLICATNRNLAEDVSAGKFREDLLARLNVWLFELPELRDRMEDIGPYIKDRWLIDKEENDKNHIRYSFNRDAWDCYIDFAKSPCALWKANYRDLNKSLERICTKAKIKGSVNIDREIVNEEIESLKKEWGVGHAPSPDPRIPEGLDPFVRVQREYVLKVCDESESLAAASRKLFSKSISEKKSSNDSDRLRKYLDASGLVWDRERGVVKAV